MFTGLAVILDHLAISHAVTSYAGKLVIAPVSDRAQMPDPACYAQCLRTAYEELESAAIGARPAKGRRGRAGSAAKKATAGKQGAARRGQATRQRATGGGRRK